MLAALKSGVQFKNNRSGALDLDVLALGLNYDTILFSYNAVRKWRRGDVEVRCFRGRNLPRWTIWSSPLVLFVLLSQPGHGDSEFSAWWCLGLIATCTNYSTAKWRTRNKETEVALFHSCWSLKSLKNFKHKCGNFALCQMLPADTPEHSYEGWASCWWTNDHESKWISHILVISPQRQVYC